MCSSDLLRLFRPDPADLPEGEEGAVHELAELRERPAQDKRPIARVIDLPQCAVEERVRLATTRHPAIQRFVRARGQKRRLWPCVGLPKRRAIVDGALRHVGNSLTVSKSSALEGARSLTGAGASSTIGRRKIRA